MSFNMNIDVDIDMLEAILDNLGNADIVDLVIQILDCKEKVKKEIKEWLED